MLKTLGERVSDLEYASTRKEEAKDIAIARIQELERAIVELREGILVQMRTSLGEMFTEYVKEQEIKKHWKKKK